MSAEEKSVLCGVCHHDANEEHGFVGDEWWCAECDAPCPDQNVIAQHWLDMMVTVPAAQASEAALRATGVGVTARSAGIGEQPAGTHGPK